MSETRFERVLQVFVFVAVCFFGMGAYRGAEAATYYIPDNYGTVQACINAAANGDTCLVRPGVYVENIVVSNMTVTIQSTDGPAATILDGNCEGSVVKLGNSSSYTAVLDGFTVRNGCAADSGGGVSITSITTTLRNCVITNNSAPYGGGVAIDGGVVRIEHSTISANVATDPAKGGGGIYSSWGLVTLAWNTISGNRSSGNGGGILNDWSGFADNFSRITDNTADVSGGGIFGIGPCGHGVYNGLISRNTASLGGGIYFDGGTGSKMELVNSTITGNTANAGGGFYSSAGADRVIILDSIVYGNSTLPVFQYVNPCSSIDYSDIEGGFSGQGNIDADPLFTNAAAGDYHLQPLSPCVNTGASAPVSSCTQSYPVPFDFDNTPRPQGPAYDMGAYEYIPTITASAGSNGTISPSGNATVTYGADQTFTITPHNGYRVADVQVDGESVGAVTTYTFSTVTTNHTISASFGHRGQL